jgi:hypothetical protein
MGYSRHKHFRQGTLCDPCGDPCDVAWDASRLAEERRYSSPIDWPSGERAGGEDVPAEECRSVCGEDLGEWIGDEAVCDGGDWL